jgi:hypothetical protein
MMLRENRRAACFLHVSTGSAAKRRLQPNPDRKPTVARADVAEW